MSTRLAEYRCVPVCGNEELVEELLKHADMAMYHAKDSGRNTVRSSIRSCSNQWKHALRWRSISAVPFPCNQLCLYYQIQLDNEHRPLGAEALLRWIPSNPRHGLAGASSACRKTMLILEIGHWVLESACLQ